MQVKIGEDLDGRGWSDFVNKSEQHPVAGGDEGEDQADDGAARGGVEDSLFERQRGDA